MKTEQELLDGLNADSDLRHWRYDGDKLMTIIRAIQLEAVRHGMTLAAELAARERVAMTGQPEDDAYNTAIKHAIEAILAERDRLSAEQLHPEKPTP